MALEWNSLSEPELVLRSRAGSLPAFDELVCRYEGRLYRFVNQLCRNASDASDIVQETFLRAFHAIGQMDPKRPFAPWLFTIARRKCIDHFRAALPVSAGDVPESLDSQTPASTLEDTESCQNLWDWARAHLPASQFELLWLRYGEDLEIAEIAKVTGRTRTSVKVLLFRARRILTQRLARSAPMPWEDSQAKRPDLRNPSEPMLALGRKEPVL
jgi:RNA polymerase sigma-70 factor (ECF subfamily)